ncbi:MAG TPA: dienelactone hydrolase family protein [Acidimicrobiia bacterium]|nr:dienelactone hydrolase family protein [Acidimicrobiia bacterium]
MRGVLVAALLSIATACATVQPTDTPPAPASPGAPTATIPAPAGLTAIPRPDGATVRENGEWYWAPAPGGRIVTLSVFRPAVFALDAGDARPTVVILHGGDGFRRLYEDLAQRYANQGFLAITGCWFQADGPPPNADEIDCRQAPSWKGMNSSSVADVDALVAAARQVPGVDPGQLVIVGHSYGAGVALLRAASGHDEPVVASSGFLAPSPLGTAIPLPTDDFASRHAATIHAPVLVVHAGSGYDYITPTGQAQAFANAMAAAGHPATTVYLAAPAGHAFPWQPPFDAVYLADAVGWIRAHLP